MAWRSLPATAAPASWLGVRLVGRNHRDLAGSTVILETDRRQLTRFVKGGGSYLSASDPRLLFGLGTAGKVDTLTVRWPSGQQQVVENPAVDRVLTVEEP